MPKNIPILDEIRDEFEESVIARPLLAELGATGGSVIPRAFFIVVKKTGAKKIKVTAMRETPSLSCYDQVQKEALKELNHLTEGGQGAVCVIYAASKGYPSEKGQTTSTMLLLDWQATDGSKKLLLMHPGRNDETATLSEIDPARLQVVSQVVEMMGRPESVLESVLDKMLPLMTPVIRAMAPNARTDDEAAAQLAKNRPVLDALKTYASDSVHLAMSLAEARADVILGHLSMTTGYLSGQLIELQDAHQEHMARTQLNWERQQSKTAGKLQRELDMTRKRADALSRQLQEARQEARKPSAGAAATLSAPSVENTASPSVSSPLASPLQRRMAKYLGRFPAFQQNGQPATPA